MKLIYNSILVALLDLLVVISRQTSGNNTNKNVLFNNSTTFGKRKPLDFELIESINNERIDLNSIIAGKAFAGGMDIDGQILFICRVRVFNELIPGKYSRPLRKCSITYKNRELQYNRYQLLVESKVGAYNWSQVKPPAKHLPSNIVMGGMSISGQFYYICQCRLRPNKMQFISQQIGKVHFDQSIQQWIATVPFSGQEVQCLDYSVLIMA